jgi:hypothetical protein
VDWGTVPAWVGAVGTVAAFAVTVALLLREIKLRREQMSDEQALQARLVWVDERFLAVQERADGQMVEARPVVHNDSNETIRDAVVRVYDESGEHIGDAFAMPRVIGPNSFVTCFLRVAVPAEREFGFLMTSADLFFTDADGRRWMKSRDQTLVRQFED